MTTLRMALRNIARQKKRTVLLGGAIAFGVMIISLVGSFTAGLTATAEIRINQLLGGHMFIDGQEVSSSGRQVSVIRETAYLEDALTNVSDEIAQIRYRSSASGDVIFGSKATFSVIEGVDWDREDTLVGSLDLVDGTIESLSDPRGLVLPRSAAEELGVRVGESVLVRMNSITGQQNAGEFVVVAITHDEGAMAMFGSAYASIGHLNSLIGMGPDQFQRANLSLANSDNVDGVAAAIEEYLVGIGKADEPSESGGMLPFAGGDGESEAGEDPGLSMMMGAMGFGLQIAEEDRWDGTKFSVTTINDVMEPILTIVTILNQVSLALFVILLLITMVGLLNTFRMILIERTREIGTIRAIGMQRGQVRSLFLTEALVLAIGGAVAGLAIASIVGAIVSAIPIGTATPLVMFLDNGTFAFPINPANIVGTFTLLTVITLASAYFPARRAALMRPADALRTNY